MKKVMVNIQYNHSEWTESHVSKTSKKKTQQNQMEIKDMIWHRLKLLHGKNNMRVSSAQ
jgi:hypothetical protein